MAAFITGLGMGLAIGILAAPKRGAESRRAVARVAHDTLDTAVTEGRDRATRAVNAAREHAPEALQPAVERAAEMLNVPAEGTERQSRGDSEPAVGGGAARGGDERINLISREDLLAIYGIGPVLADRIIEGRPYRSIDELRDRGILNEATFSELQRELRRPAA